jgi:endonuclease/exonuclease/phosphatase family metal-dependent hydrolase
MNLYGNKGSVGTRLEFGGTSLCFLNCHLPAGETQQAFQLRNEHYSSIHQRMVFHSASRRVPWNIDEHNGIFLFGDLNYRQTERNEDELMQKTNILQTYSEAPIKFSPTYKYELSSDTYNAGRRSSWTDRILYRSNQCRIQPLDYWTTSMIRFSDHRPVAKLFSLARFVR